MLGPPVREKPDAPQIKVKVPKFQLPTPVNPHILNKYLEGYDPKARTYLVKGFVNGFGLGTVGSVKHSTPRNHPSTIKYQTFLRNKIHKEIQLGRIMGPFDHPPLDNFITSPLGVVPKKEPNKFRLIHDLSYPTGHSVNSIIPFEHSTVSLETFDNVAALVVKCGNNCLISKADIEEAFRIIPMSPIDYHKLGFQLDGKFYFDKVLPMGASSSVQIFESLSKSLQWILVNKFKVPSVSHIVDDFIFVGAADSSECADGLNKFLSLCHQVNIPIKSSKTVLPTTCAQVHGITIDTIKMEASLPEDKVSTLRTLLNSSKRRKKMKLRDIQSLLGHLNFACKVIRPGRCFLRRLYDLICGKTKQNRYIKFNSEVRADLSLWSDFIEVFNGTTLLSETKYISNNALNLHTDAALSKGFAFTYKHNWAWGAFSEKIKQFHINILELYPISLAVCLFGHEWENQNILFICDNMSIVQCINKQTSKDKIIMKLLRKIVLTSLQFNFCFAAKHIPSKHNTICDLLSRFQIDKARSLAPDLHDTPVTVPPHLTPESLLL